MTNQEPITWTFSLWEFNPKKYQLLTLANQYDNLSINWVDDKDWYKAVHEASMVLVRTRTDIEKKGKQLRDPHTQFNKKVKEIEDDLISIIDKTEKKLKAEKKRIDDERIRIEEEQLQKKREQLQVRINSLTSINVSDINIIALQEMTNEEFKNLYDTKYQNFLIIEEEKRRTQESIDKINYCKTIEEIKSLSNIEDVVEVREAYNKKRDQLEFEEQQKEFRKQQDILNKQLEEQRKEI